MILFPFADTATRTPAAASSAPGEGGGGADNGEGVVVEEELEDDEPTVGEEVNATLLALLPWGVSLVFHAALVLLALFVVWAVLQPQEDEEYIVPSVTLSDSPGAPIELVQQKEVTETSSRRSPVPQVKPSPSQTVTTVEAPDLTGFDTPDAGGSPMGVGDMGEGAAFNAKFFGQGGGNAKRIVYLVDASGSMVDLMPHVLAELKRSIQQLDPAQSFDIIFFNGVPPTGRQNVQAVPVPLTGLKPASAENTRAVITWLNDTPILVGGGGDPAAAIREALNRNPQLIFLLSDNITGPAGTPYEKYQKGTWSTPSSPPNVRNTKISTIQFVDKDPLASIPGHRGTLDLVAEATGGKFKFVSGADLGLR